MCNEVHRIREVAFMRTIAPTLCVLLVLSVFAYADAPTTVNIQVAPATIVLKAPLKWITIHADIDYSAVNAASVCINGLDADLVFADDRGDLVAKVSFPRIAPQLLAGSAEIVLTGVTNEGDAFSGSETVRVK